MKMPVAIEPMAATLYDEAFDGKDWCFEIKHDGYRLLSFIDKGKVKLQSRNLKDFTATYPTIAAELQHWKHNVILDGEIVALDENGATDFEALQSLRKHKNITLHYFVFDLLWLNGKDYRQVPLRRRKKTLQHIFPPSTHVSFLDDIPFHGIAAFNMAKEEQLEGIVAKRLDSIYQPGIRTDNWRKIKCTQDAEFIIAGFTRTTAAMTGFSTLILGAYHKKKLQFCGEVGTGFSESTKQAILAQLAISKQCPFPATPQLTSRWRTKKPAFIAWCRPVVVCTVRYYQKTKEGLLRHPSFKGLRSDVKPHQVTLS